jgi:nitrate/nitrite transport system permease protein
MTMATNPAGVTPDTAKATAYKPVVPVSAAARKAREAAGRVLPPMIGLAVVLGIWQLACSGPGAMLPGPAKVVHDTWGLIVDPFFDHGGVDKGLFWHLFASLKRVAVGFTLSAMAGIFLGVLIGQSTMAYRALDPIFQVLRTVPPLAWLPISLAAFRQADPSAIFVIFKIVMPATVPYIFTGLKIGIGLSWLAIVAAEMLIGGVGIGFFIWDAWNSSLMSEIILALIYVGLVGFMLDRMITFVGQKFSS